MCRRRGVGRLRNLHDKELSLQDQVAAKNVKLGRVPSEDNEADLGTKYLKRDRIERCMTKMGMLFPGARAGELLLVVSGTEMIIWVDLIEGQSWLMVLCCSSQWFAVFNPHLPTGNVHVTTEPAITKQWSMSPRAVQYSGNQHTEFVWEAGTVLAVHYHHECEHEQRLPNSRVVVVFGWTTRGDDYLHQSKVDSCSPNWNTES